MKLIFMSALIVLVAAACAQVEETPTKPSFEVLPHDKTGGFGANSAYEGRFDAKTVIKFSGRISGIDFAPPRPGMEAGVILLVKTANGGTATVDIGPSWYFDKQDVRYEIHDYLDVTGSKVMEDGHGLILASRVIGGGYDLKLRDGKGLPVWDAYRAEPPSDLNGLRSVTGVISKYNPDTGMTSVETDAGAVQIQTGPLWFQERQSYTATIGDNITFYAGPTQQISPGVFITTDTARVGDGYIAIGNDGTPVWKSAVPIKDK